MERRWKSRFTACPQLQTLPWGHWSPGDAPLGTACQGRGTGAQSELSSAKASFNPVLGTLQGTAAPALCWPVCSTLLRDEIPIASLTETLLPPHTAQQRAKDRTCVFSLCQVVIRVI